MKLFHGTIAKEEIIASGFNTELVFLCASRSDAEAFGDVVEVWVDDDALMVDLDIPGARGVSVETANLMTDETFESARDYAEAGYAVCVPASAVISIY